MRAILATVLAVWASAAYAQPAPPSASADLNAAFDMKCQTALCFRESQAVARMAPHHTLGPLRSRQPIPARNISQCNRADVELGRWLSRLNNVVNENEAGRGGVLTYPEAAKLRTLIYTESYYIRKQLRAQIAWGEVRACNEFKDRAIFVVNDAVSRGFGYGAPPTQGPYYRNH